MTLFGKLVRKYWRKMNKNKFFFNDYILGDGKTTPTVHLSFQRHIPFVFGGLKIISLSLNDLLDFSISYFKGSTSTPKVSKSIKISIVLLFHRVTVEFYF